MTDSSMDTVMRRLFGNPNWHQVIERPGTWTYERSTQQWLEPAQQERNMTSTDTTLTIPAVSALEIVVPKPPNVVDLTGHADLVRQYDDLTATINLAKAQQEEIKEKLKVLFGDATQATVNGVPTLTYQKKASFRTADVAKDFPELVAQYKVRELVEKIDWTKLIAHHGGGVLAGYQVREFRRVSRG